MAQDRANVPVHVEAAGRTDVGRRRDHNEDNLLLQQDLQLFVVADGMGGHNAGEVASALATTSLENFFAAADGEEIPDSFAGEDDGLQPSAKRLKAAVRKANADVYEIASKMKQHSGMGSTVVVAHVSLEEERVHICHVGDSRCYRIRDGEIEQLTRDHSLINDALAMRPDLTEDILAELPANVITRAVGTQATVQVDLRSEELHEEDLYLLCTDGLSGLVSEEQIVEVCSLTDELDELCELLIIMANEAGGNDNITALAIRIESPDAVRPSVHDLTEEVAIAVGDTPEPVDIAPVVQLESDELDAEPEAAEDEEAAESPPPIEVAPVVEMTEGRSYPPPPSDEADVVVASLEVEAGALVEDIDVEVDEAELEVVEERETALAASEGVEAAVAVCTACGHELVEGVVFCVECGTRISAASTATVPLSELQASTEAHIDIGADEGDEDGDEDGEYDDEDGDEDGEYDDEDGDEDGEYDDEDGDEDGEYDDEDGDEDDAPAFCHECGARLIADNRFCVQCGARA